MNPGIYGDISNHDYHTGPGISTSGLKLISKSPLHYVVRQRAANDNKPQSEAFMIGTAFHALLLEPEEFTKNYCLGLRQSEYPDAIDGRDQLVAMVNKLNEGRLPKLPTTGAKDELVARILDALDDRSRTPEVIAEFQAMKGAELKANIEALNETRQGLLSTSGTIEQLSKLLRAEGVQFKLWSDIQAEWLQNNGHRIVLTPVQWDQLMNMRAAVMAHPMAARLMSMQGKAEQSVYWTDVETGELCRCRPDWWPSPFMVDVKTTDDASEEAFARSIATYGYDVQDAFYTDGAAAIGKPQRAFLFLVVQKDAHVIDGQSFGVAVYQLDQASRELGRAKYREALRTYAECRKTGKWPNYGDQINAISLPQWNFVANSHLVTDVVA